MHGAVLAGGSARRFGGRPKGLERVGNRRILDRVSSTIQSAIGALPTLIADPATAVEWQHDLSAIGDAIPGCGSLGGIYTALTTSSGPTLVVAWDMPFVSKELLLRLVDGSTGFDAYLPESIGPLGVEPLCAVYGPGCVSAIEDRLRARDLRTTGFHDRVRIGTIPLAEVQTFGDPETLFLNVNSEADLARARALCEEHSR